MEHSAGVGSVQGLWQSEAHSELSLAETRGGMLVGVYRVRDASGITQHALSGHAVAGHLAFSVPFLDQGVLATWTGSMVPGADGARLELVRRVLGDGGHDDVTEVYRRPAAEAAGVFPLPVRAPDVRSADSSAV